MLKPLQQFHFVQIMFSVFALIATADIKGLDPEMSCACGKALPQVSPTEFSIIPYPTTAPVPHHMPFQTVLQFSEPTLVVAGKSHYISEVQLIIFGIQFIMPEYSEERQIFILGTPSKE